MFFLKKWRNDNIRCQKKRKKKKNKLRNICWPFLFVVGFTFLCDFFLLFLKTKSVDGFLFWRFIVLLKMMEVMYNKKKTCLCCWFPYFSWLQLEMTANNTKHKHTMVFWIDKDKPNPSSGESTNSVEKERKKKNGGGKEVFKKKRR